MPCWLPKISPPKPPNPWMTPDIWASKRHRRYQECGWCRNLTTLNRSRHTKQTHLCDRQMSKAKSAHYSINQIQIPKLLLSTGDHGSLWKAINKIFHHCPRVQKLNPDNTEFLLFRNEQQQGKYLSVFAIELFSVKTNAAKSARNLGVIFDRNSTCRSYVSSFCTSCFYLIRDLRHIHFYLDVDSTRLLAAALVSSRCDNVKM